jgi:hypothetical protein
MTDDRARYVAIASLAVIGAISIAATTLSIGSGMITFSPNGVPVAELADHLERTL